MKANRELSINDLLSRIEVLENENLLLAEQAEDMTLMSMLSEISSGSQHIRSMLDEVLERISMLKDIVFCTCGILEGNDLKPVAAFWQLDDEDTLYHIRLEDSLLSELREGVVLVQGKKMQQLTFCKRLESMKDPIHGVVIVPFLFQMKQQAAFLFADNSRAEPPRLVALIPLLRQITYQVEDRINNLYLLEELKQAKTQLESRVNERTKALQETNETLTEEISRRALAEHQLQLSEEKFRETFNNANDAFILWEATPHGSPVKCLEVNDVFLKLTGYTEEEVMHLTAKDFRGTENAESLEERLKFAAEHDHLRFEVPLKTKSGTQVPTEVSSRRFRLQNRDVILAVHRDITERKEFEARLLDAKKQAEESDRLKSVFLANMSHEIRTPMNAIVGFSELLQQDGFSAEEKNSFLDILRQKSNELLTLINDILYLSKIEANQVSIQERRVNVPDFIEKSEIAWKILLEKSGKQHLHFRVEYTGPDMLYARMDDVRVSQVLNNLVVNALKFTEQGEILVTCEVDDRFLKFKVKDTGIGIPEEKQQLIFERFRQADEGQTRKFGGSGLGLTISYELIQLMGGNIQVNSEQGSGAEFRFAIPLLTDPEDAQAETASARNPKRASRMTGCLLVVEDEWSNFQLLEAALSNHDFEILHAVTGEEAKMIFTDRQDIDLVLMDLHLPGMDGIEASRQLRHINNKITIIAQTAVSPDEVKKIDGYDLVDDFIYKPININTLYHTLAKYLLS